MFSNNCLLWLKFISLEIFLWALSLFLYDLKHSVSNHGDVKSDLMQIYGIYLSTREKRLFLKADQASSGSIQSRITSQCMLPNSLFMYIIYI